MYLKQENKYLQRESRFILFSTEYAVPTRVSGTYRHPVNIGRRGSRREGGLGLRLGDHHTNDQIVFVMAQLVLTLRPLKFFLATLLNSTAPVMPGI